MNSRRALTPAPLWFQFAAAAVCLLPSAPARADAATESDPDLQWSGWWGEVGLGASRVSRSPGVTAGRVHGNFALHLRVGHTLGPHLVAGLLVDGNNADTSGPLYIDGIYVGGSPNRGPGIGLLAAFLRLYPLQERSWFVEGAAGSAKFFSSLPGETNGWGPGFQFAVGRDFNFGDQARWSLEPSVGFSAGRAGAVEVAGTWQKMNYRAAELTLGLAYHP